MSNISISKLSSWFGGVILIITIFYIIHFDPSSFNPDYVAYEKIYDFITNQDFKIYFAKFAFLDYFVRLLDFTGDYDNFRLTLASVELFLFILILRGLKITWNKLNIFISLSLSAFLLLKVHVQIREGFSLLIWLLSLNSTSKEKFFTLKNIIFFIISSFLHSATIVFWIPTLIFKSFGFSAKRKRTLIVIFFFLIGMTVWPFFYNKLNFGSSYDVFGYGLIEINASKILYWLSFFLVYFLIWRNENSKITAVNQKIIQNNNLSIIGNIGFYGILGFVPAAALAFLGGAPNAVIFNLIFRLILNLFFLITFYRSASQPKNFYTSLLNSFIFIIVFELLVVAIN